MKARATIDVRSLRSVQRLLKRYPSAGTRALAAALFEEATDTMAESRREVPVDQGVLRASGFVELPRVTAGRIEVELGYGGAATAYARVVHDGAGPFWPPIAPLLEWARRHGMDEGAAYAIQHTIATRGIVGRPYLLGPFERSRRGLGARLARRARRKLEQMGRT